MKKILFMSSQPFFQWRGSPIRVGFDVQALAELGYSVDLLTLPIGEKRVIPGVNIIRVPNLILRKNIPIGPSIAKALYDVLIFIKGVFLVLTRKYDVIHCIEDTGPIGIVLSKLSGSRVVFEKHSDPGSYRKGLLRNMVMAVYSGCEKFAIRHADAVIGTGPGLVKQAKNLVPDKPVYHIFDIPSSLAEASPEKTHELRKLLAKAKDRVLVTFVGSFAVYQGVDLLFKSIPIALKGCSNLRFIIIGGTPSEIAQRKKYLKSNDVEKYVNFIGKVSPDDLPDYLNASDILVSPRRAGVNTPLKILDYMKAGRAILATDVESNRLILDKEAAIFVNQEEQSFCAGLMGLANSREKRERYGSKGRRLIDEKYNFANFKQLLKECYEGLGI